MNNFINKAISKEAMKEILEKVKKELRPDESILFEVDKTASLINYLLKKDKIRAVCVKGGSTAKGTFIKDDYDVDLFVRFDYMMRNKDISGILEKVLEKEFEIQRVHGSRDYFQFKKNNLLFEIVPVLLIDDYRKALNVTDMSPLHVDYIKKKLKKGQTDEIRLAKQFCKSAKVYGAESYIKGFSGHILDLLIIHYGGFKELIKNAVNWNAKVIIDIENQLKDPLKELDKSKTHSPLIIVDPVQPSRNAAAAMSKERFDMFIERCKKFLIRPSKSFFIVKNLSKEQVEKKVLPDEELFYLEATPLEGKKDIIGAKIMKVYEHIQSSLEKNDFEIVKTSWEFKDVGRIYFIIKKEDLPSTKIISGPPIDKEEGVKRFKEMHKEIFEEGRKFYAREKRKYKTASKLIKDLIKDDYIKERIKKIIIY